MNALISSGLFDRQYTDGECDVLKIAYPSGLVSPLIRATWPRTSRSLQCQRLAKLFTGYRMLAANGDVIPHEEHLPSNAKKVLGSHALCIDK